MLTRRHLRIKVMQSLYSFFKTEKKEIYTDLFFLEQSIKNTFSLYVLLLSYLKALYDHSIKIKGDVKKVKTLVISDKFKFIIGNDILRHLSLFDSCNSGFTIFHVNQHYGYCECVIKSLTKHVKSYYKMHSHMLSFHW